MFSFIPISEDTPRWLYLSDRRIPLKVSCVRPCSLRRPGAKQALLQKRMEIHFLSSPRLQGVAYQGTLSASFTLSLLLCGLPKVYFHFVALIQSRRLSPPLSSPLQKKKKLSQAYTGRETGVRGH